MSEARLCADYADDWSAYLDAELPGEREALLRTHLEGCDLCAGRVAALRAADAALLDDLPLPEIGGDLRERLQTRIDADTVTSLGSERERRRRIAPLAGLLAAAAAVAIYLAVARETPLSPGETEPAIAHTEVPPVPEEPTAEPELPEVELAHDAMPDTPKQPDGVVPEPEVIAVEEAPATRTADPLLDTANELDAASEEELALVFELDTIEDLDVIENLDLIEALLSLEEGTG